jgi:hypothetical protein
MEANQATPPVADDAPRARFQTRPSDHRFFGVVAVVSALVTLAGFARTYGPKVLGGTALPGIIHFHAAVFTSWLVLMVSQVALAARGRLELHRRVGTFGALLAVVMGILGSATAIVVTRLGDRGIKGVMFPEPGGFLLLNLASVGVFVALAGAGWMCRARPQAHKRLMLLATISLAPPGLARLFAGVMPPAAAMVFALLLAGPVYDLVSR